MLNEMSQRERQILYDLAFMQNLNKTKQNKTPLQTHRYREQIGGCLRQGLRNRQNGGRQSKGTNFQLGDKSQGCNIEHGNCS